MKNAEWYVNWFDSPYYHLLYNNRNLHEANAFIDNLCEKLELKPHARLWDNACGRGRHAIALNNKGFDVVGTDLSRNSINAASKAGNEHLDFFVHDMREAFRINYFDAAFNLFTSIGYFRNFNDNFLVFNSVAKSLKPRGVFVIDFLNAYRVETSNYPDLIEKREAVNFHIRKKITNDAIIKRIDFESEGRDYYFEESVSLLKKQDFENFANAAGMRLEATYGDYQLDVFNESNSERLILIFKK
jgi:cyclopropane fatty-acyl-phospholipid synthase-like methyltransferase